MSLAKTLFNAACLAAIVVVGVISGSPSQFLSIFSVSDVIFIFHNIPLRSTKYKVVKSGAENVQELRHNWRKRKGLRYTA